jgi:HD-like signal output (HDOD) protein/GGDEF domain-containing protein
MIETVNNLDQLAAKSGQLYSLPGVAMRVLQLTRNPHVETRALKECIENDPAISARILRVVNSSLFGLRSEVSDLAQAVTLLGIKPLKLLVLGFSLPSGLFLDVESKMLLWYWKHTLTKAVAGRELSHRLWRIPGDEAFLAGLFQDLGVLLLFQHLGQPYARFLDRAVSHRLDIGLLEQRSLGFSHTELSARLLTQWNFPESLCEAIAWQPAEGEYRPALTQILHLSELVAQLFADGRTSALAELYEAGHDYCRHIDQQLEPLVPEIEQKVNELADIFSLALPDGLEYRDVLAEAHRQLTQVTTQAAGDLLRNRVPEGHDAGDDWFWTDIESLTDALSDACAEPIEGEPQQARSREQGAGSREQGGRSTALPPCSEPGTPWVAPSSLGPAGYPLGGGLIAANLLDRLTGIVAACRPMRRPLSLLLVKLAAAEELAKTCGPQEIAAIRQVFATVCGKLDHPGKVCLPHSDFSFALILPGADRKQAIELGNDLIRSVRTLSMAAGTVQKDSLKLDIGVATVAQPPKNFPPRDLFVGAERCLYASHASGGSVVKSIEIY